MSAPAPLRLRCPADSPRAADRHLAIDVRLPLPIGPALSQLSRLRCHCGEELVIDTRATEAASADTEDRRSDARIRDALLDCLSVATAEAGAAGAAARSAVGGAPSSAQIVEAIRASIEGMHASRDAVCAENDGLHVRIAALEHALREVLSTAPEGGARWVVAMARARKVLEGGER